MIELRYFTLFFKLHLIFATYFFKQNRSQECFGQTPLLPKLLVSCFRGCLVRHACSAWKTHSSIAEQQALLMVGGLSLNSRILCAGWGLESPNTELKNPIFTINVPDIENSCTKKPFGYLQNTLGTFWSCSKVLWWLCHVDSLIFRFSYLLWRGCSGTFPLWILTVNCTIFLRLRV